MSADLDVLLERLHLANARRIWRDLVPRAEKEQGSHDQLLHTLFAEEVAHRRGTRLSRAVRAAKFLRTPQSFRNLHQGVDTSEGSGLTCPPACVGLGRTASSGGAPTSTRSRSD